MKKKSVFLQNKEKSILTPDEAELWNDIIGSSSRNIRRFLAKKINKKQKIKILNPAAGHGTEAQILIFLLKELGLSSEEAFNSIYLVDSSVEMCNKLKMKGFKNVFCENFLKWKTPEQNMKFDLILTNPPYASGAYKQMYLTFVNKCLDHLNDAGILSVVCPATWLKMEDNTFLRVIDELNIITLNIDECGKYFPHIKTSFSYFVGEKTFEKTKTQIITPKNTCNIDIRNYKNLSTSRVFDDPLYNDELNILEKIFSKGVIVPFNENFELDKQLSYEKTKEHEYECYLSSKSDRQLVYSNVKGKHYDQLKLAVAHILEPGRTNDFSKIITYNTGRYAVYFLGSLIELENIQMFFHSSIYYFIDRVLRHGRYAYLKIPKLDFSKTWVNQELYEYFNLTQEEIDLIESSVK
jgi:hypothetical protein